MSDLLDDLRCVQVLVTQENGGVMTAYLDGGPDRHNVGQRHGRRNSAISGRREPRRAGVRAKGGGRRARDGRVRADFPDGNADVRARKAS